MIKTIEEWLEREIKSADAAMNMRADEKAYQMAAMWHDRKETLCEAQYQLKRLKGE